LRRFLENSAGDSIFHRDNLNAYMNDTILQLKNDTIKLQQEKVNRKREIIDPGMQHVFKFPKDKLDEEQRRKYTISSKIGSTKDKRFLKEIEEEV